MTTASWRSDFITANGLRFHYVTEGEGPLILLLHGFPQFWRSWRHQIPALSKRHKVVAVDMRGYGDTDKPPRVRDYHPDRLAEDVAALIRAFGYKKAHVIGHDWGGGVAWGTALSHPEVVDKLVVLNCPHPRIFMKALVSTKQFFRSWYIFFFQLPFLPELALKGKIGGVIAGSSARPEAFSAEDRAAYDEAFAKPGAATAAFNYYRAAFRYNADARKAAQKLISAPTLLIWGDQDRALGVALTKGMEGLFTGPFKIRHIPEASHWVNEDEPEQVNRLILEFLAPN